MDILLSLGAAWVAAAAVVTAGLAHAAHDPGFRLEHGPRGL